MKRVGNLYERICGMSNLQLADKKARKGKKKQHGIRVYDRNKEANLLVLQDNLRSKTYRTSQYTVFKIYEHKERTISRLPYYPDRVTHHAVMNILEPIFVGMFTADTYSCIKKRGIHGAAQAVEKSLRDKINTEYCLKLDIRKFYPSIDHEILKQLLRKKIKDVDLLWLLDEIIDSADGIPIGNYLSQYFANFYLTYFDHWLNEVKGVKYYFRYADDMVILSGSKEYLHNIFCEIQSYLKTKLNLEVKENYQIFPVHARGIDFVGYVFYHSHTLMRKRIKKNFAIMMVKNRNPKSIASYMGWAKHCNSINLTRKLHEQIQRPRHKGSRKQKASRRQNQD